jgi:hypothetical protein
MPKVPKSTPSADPLQGSLIDETLPSLFEFEHPAALLTPGNLAMPIQLTPEEEDLPILTEIVTIKAAEKSPLFDKTQISALTSEIVDAVRQQLSFELSTLLEAVLLSTSEELRASIAVIVETAVRDYLARRFSSKNTDGTLL